MSELMEDEVYYAAVVGDVTVFSNKNEEQLLRKTSQNNNIIHIAAQHQRINFIQAAFNSLPKTPTCESLICDQNRHGNTPLHIAAEVGDEAVVHKLYEYFTVQCGSDSVFPWRVLNKDGNTPAHVALLYGNVSLAVYLVVKDGCLARVLNHSKETLLHLAIQYHVFETQGHGSDIWPIIELLLQIDSSVTCWEDADGATPLHAATSLKPAYCVPVIKAMLASCPKAAEVYDEGSGQTILHRLTNHQVASYKESLELLRIPQVYALRNSKNGQGDTPLHLAARNRDSNMVQALLGSSAKLGIKNKSGVSAGSLVQQLEEMRFKETPTEDRRKLTEAELEAAKQRNIAFLNEKLVSLGTDLLVSRTPKGGNILHILMQCKIDKDEINETEEFIGQAIQKVPLLIRQKDCNGDTPIHILVQNNEYSVRLLELCCSYFDRDGVYYPPWKLKNLKGDTALHVAVRAEHFDTAVKLLDIDDEFEKFLSEAKNHLLGHRSLYGIPTTKIVEYANTIGVIAALLATITFTAAFTVPGGLDSSNGSPLLLQKAIFKVFMVGDMVALYSSVMVLFCLLWIMTTACKKDTILLLDVSVFLLQTSFLATLVTFMTGLYVTTISTSPSIAISTCATCTLLIILMRKKLVMLTVVPACTTLIIWGKALGRFVSNPWSSLHSMLLSLYICILQMRYTIVESFRACILNSFFSV